MAWHGMAFKAPLGTILPVAEPKRTQTLVQLNDELLRRLDERAAREGRSRSALIRDAIETHLHDEERARIDREIIEGYERIPTTDEELREAERETREAIREEPW
jgi:metal-responsive CopG/Arc/MetJ family transcriptional regulator